MAAVPAVEEGGVAGASGAGGSWGVYRHGSRIMVEDGAKFPCRCAVCDREAVIDPIRLRLVAQWNCSCSPVVARRYPELVGKCGYTGPVTVHLHLCSRHRRRRLYVWGLMATLVLLPLAYWAYLIAAGAPAHRAQWLLPMLLLVAGAAGMWNVSIGSWNPWLKAFRYRDRYVWLAWANPAFVARLPEFKGPPIKALRATTRATELEAKTGVPSRVARA